MFRKVLLIGLVLFTIVSFAGPHYATGTIVKVSGSSDPAVLLSGSVPTECDSGNYGWIKFAGSDSPGKHRTYSTALAAAIAGKTVTVYTNSDGEYCRINFIEVNM